jgi:hypothetical protein
VLFHRLCIRVGLPPPGANPIAVNNKNKKVSGDIAVGTYCVDSIDSMGEGGTTDIA